MTNSYQVGNIIGYENTYHVITMVNQKGEVDSRWLQQPLEERDYKHTGSDIQPIEMDEMWHNLFGVQMDGFHSFVYPITNMKMNLGMSIVFSGDYVYLRQGSKEQRCWDDNLVSIFNKDRTRREMYVHEFQNYYLLLTGEPLILKKLPGKDGTH